MGFVRRPVGWARAGVGSPEVKVGLGARARGVLEPGCGWTLVCAPGAGGPGRVGRGSGSARVAPGRVGRGSGPARVVR
jgi:hypothetical protein